MNISLILKNVIKKQSEINSTLNKILFELRCQESYKQKYLTLLNENSKNKQQIKPEILALTIDSEQCLFTTRTINALKNGNINTVEELIGHSKKEIKRFRNLGAKGLAEIMEFLDLYNLKLK